MKEEILRIYKIFHRGRQNAITRYDFQLKYWEELPDLTDREFRRIYSQLPICTCSAGGFYPIRPSEIEDFRDYMKKKAIPLFERFNLVRDSHPDLAKDVRQLELFR